MEFEEFKRKYQDRGWEVWEYDDPDLCLACARNQSERRGKLLLPDGAVISVSMDPAKISFGTFLLKYRASKGGNRNDPS